MHSYKIILINRFIFFFLVSDPTTILKILDQLQQRLNAASIVVSTQQDENNIKIVSQKVKCWNVLNRLATLGLDLNLVEMHLSESALLSYSKFIKF